MLHSGLSTMIRDYDRMLNHQQEHAEYLSDVAADPDALLWLDGPNPELDPTPAPMSPESEEL